MIYRKILHSLENGHTVTIKTKSKTFILKSTSNPSGVKIDFDGDYQLIVTNGCIEKYIRDIIKMGRLEKRLIVNV